MTSKRLTIAEARSGYIQEANRLFFHPLGLALSVKIPKNGDESKLAEFTLIDNRDDQEGIVYDIYEDELYDFRQQESKVRSETAAKAAIRADAFGWVIQPCEPFVALENDAKETEFVDDAFDRSTVEDSVDTDASED